MATAPAIDFNDVSLRFISQDGNATVALRNFSMSVARGEFVAIVGPTGCGKSTTLNMITGLLQAHRGRSAGDGPAGRPASIRASASCSRPTRCFRGARATTTSPPARCSRPVEIRRSDAGADAAVAAPRRPRQVRQALPAPALGRHAQARGAGADLHQQPRDPADGRAFSALDMQTRTLMQDELLQLWSGNGGSVVFVTHDLDEAIALADRVFVLSARPAHAQARLRDRPAAPARHVGGALRPAVHRTLAHIWDDLREEVRSANERHYRNMSTIHRPTMPCGPP